MSGIQPYLLLAAVVFGVNLMPAFAPPTWTVLVFFKITYDLPIVALVPLGALCAASGRLVLGTVAKRSRRFLSAARVEHLDALRALTEQRRAVSFSALTLFAISPIPSASLFIGAGVTGMRLLPLTAAFFCGRIVSYTLYVSAAIVAEDSIRSVVQKGFTSPWSIALQLLALAFLAALLLVPWSKLLARFASGAATDQHDV